MVVFRCEVGVDYGFNSEINHQRRCSENKPMGQGGQGGGEQKSYLGLT